MEPQQGSIAGRTAPVLYQNVARDITLIDIPFSISLAQGVTNDTLLSSSPVTKPFVTNEPKSDAAKAKVAQNTIDEELHAIYQVMIDNALAKIKENVAGDWCLPRKVMAKLPSKAKGKKQSSTLAIEAQVSETSLGEHLKSLQEDPSNDIAAMMSSLKVSPGTGALKASWVVSYKKPTDFSDAKVTKSTGEPVLIQEAWDWAFHNPYDHCLDLTVFKDSNGSMVAPKSAFKLPPRSTFYLHDCIEPSTFRSAFRSITEDHKLPRHFNFVLLDPPWPNKSAKRKGSYSSYSNTSELKRMMLKMDLDLYVEYDALIGIWITNRPSLRKLVLGPGGLFERLNVGLIEEWIWIKTTTNGEPISAMDSMWRKPYEVLLLGRAAKTSYAVAEPAQNIKRRVIAGVPDLHSRKPCVKELIAPFMPDPEDYSALEIFPRHLVAGWSSWGNEVLKFDWDGYWVSSGGDESRTSVDADVDKYD